MGITHVTIEVANPATPEAGEPVDLVVDSGAVYSVIQRRVLERLGIKPVGREEFRLASGERISRQKGIAAFRYGERVGGADVIFGEEGDMDLLGALTLGSLGLSLDPLKRELKPLPMLLA
jgi:predicted aspartyl protease